MMLRRIIEHPILSVLCFSLPLGFISPWILQNKFSYSPGIIICTCFFLTLSLTALNIIYCFCSLKDEETDFSMKMFEMAGLACGIMMFFLLCTARGIATGFNYVKALTEGPLPIASEWVLYIPMILSFVGYMALRFFGFKIKSRVLFCVMCVAIFLGISAFVMASVQYGKETVFVHVLNANVIIVLVRTIVKSVVDFVSIRKV